jgi:hypothetical protein
MNQLHSPDLIPNTATIHLTDRQLKYLALRAQGVKRRDAVIQAGYNSQARPGMIEKSGNLRDALIKAFDVQGLTTDRLAEKISKGLDSKKIQFSSYKGKIVEEREVPDNETQHKYVRTALEVRGDLQAQGIQVNVGLIQVPGQVKDIDAWNEEK